MHTLPKIATLACALLLGAWMTATSSAQTPYAITAHSDGLRQTFAGFGVSQVTTSWSDLSPPIRDQMADLVFRDLEMNILRLWISSDHTQTVSSMLAEFNSRYVASGLIADVMARGVDTLLLAPCRSAPVYSWTSPPAESMSAYAERLAEVIAQIELAYGVQIHATGIANEPGSWSAQQMIDCVNELRARLDARGLGNVKIIAPETSNGSSGMLQFIDPLFADGAAWRNLSGIAHHSYFRVLPNVRQWERRRDKEWWMTESSDAGNEQPEDEHRASTILGRFLCDLNAGVDHWLYFIGMRRVANAATDSNAHAYLAVYDQATSSVILYLRYHYFRQALHVLRKGAVMRRCSSATEGGMFNHLNQNPAINAAVGLNPDGSWGVNIVNTTGIVGSPHTPNSSPPNLFHPENHFSVTITIEELASVPSTVFSVWRSKAHTHFSPAGTVTFVNGVGTVTVHARELVSLRSPAASPSIPPAPVGLSARSAINAPVVLDWHNTVGADTWIIKRGTSSAGPFTPIDVSSDTRYIDLTATPGTAYHYTVSARNAVGESGDSAVVAAPTTGGFTNQDVGSTGLAGGLTISPSGTYTVTGAGASMASTADGFNFTWIKMAGDGTFIARLVSAPPVAGAPNLRVGLMMRDELVAQSSTAAILFEPGHGRARWYARTTENTGGNYVTGPNISTAQWLRLVRVGNTVTGHISSDGVAWTQVASNTFRLFSDIHVGLVVCTSNPSVTATATFDNIRFTPQAVQGLRASASGASVALTWQPVFGATGYKVKRASAPGGPYATVATPALPQHTDSTGGAPGFYVVSATGPLGEGPDSAELRGDTVALWDFSRGGGQRVPDRRLSGIALKPVDASSTLAWVREGLGGALRFDGTLRLNPAFSAPVISLPDGTVAVEAWIKPAVSHLGTRGLGILQYGDYKFNGFRLIVEQNRRVSWLVQNGSNEIMLQSSAPVVGGVWTHVGATYDGSTMKLYLDGVLVGSRALSGGIVQPANNGQLRIGHISSGSNTFFQGEIRSVRISGRPEVFF